MRQAWLRTVVTAWVAAACPVLAFATDPAPKAKKPAALTAPAAQLPPLTSVVLPDPPLPVSQALSLGMTNCVPALAAMARDTLTAHYDVQSGWHRTDPARHVFQTVAGVSAPANNPPDSFAALIAAPVSAGGCDGVSIQVLPLAGTCQTARKVIETGGKSLGGLLGSQIMLDAAGKRIILLPGAANTCIAISVDSRFGTK